MTDSPLRGSVDLLNVVELPYVPEPIPTSRSDVRVRIVLILVWVVMFSSGLLYVSRYALVNPYVDEWAFVPVLFGERPAGPWLWELHNEHRFPLPRLIYLGLFRLTGDLRTGCWVSFLGISLLAAGLIRLARTVRGRSHLADAVFPLLLMHTGQGENLYMGYQLAFMLTSVLTGVLLGLIVTTTWRRESDLAGPNPTARSNSDCDKCNHFRRGLQSAIVGWLLLTCGAGGLVYGMAAAVWVVLLAVFGRMSLSLRVVLAGLAAGTPLYAITYFHGYVRPSHHPPSAGVIESARVALEAQSMAFGPAATGLWPVIGLIVLVVGIKVTFDLAIHIRRDLRFAGLLLYLGAGAAVAFGIGWGRSGFMYDMGFAWRYGWITLPFLFAAYFTWLLRGGRVAAYGSCALALVALVLAPVNAISGFLNAEKKVRAFEIAWEADVRAGQAAELVVNKHFPEYPDEMRQQVIEAMRLMRDRGYAYYESLGRETP
jgi:hypothetical protein